MRVGSALAVVLGIVAQIGSIAAYRRGDLDLPTSCLTFGLGAGLACAGLWHLYIVFVVEPAHKARKEELLRQHPHEPWLLDTNWAQRKVVDRSSLQASIFLWAWAIGWWVFCGFLWNFDAERMYAAAQNSWLEAGLLLLLVAIGVLGIAAAIGATLKWVRYGQSTLQIDTLPGCLGNRFRGVVVARVPTEFSLEAEIACERVTVVWTRSREQAYD
jgi:hypothetical protein